MVTPAAIFVGILLAQTPSSYDVRLRLYITGAEIRQRLPDFVPGGRYTVRATLTLSVPTGSSSAQWSDAFVESIFPARERSRTFTKELEFGRSRVPDMR